jgi:hypothetical protein
MAGTGREGKGRSNFSNQDGGSRNSAVKVPGGTPYWRDGSFASAQFSGSTWVLANT